MLWNGDFWSDADDYDDIGDDDDYDKGQYDNHNKDWYFFLIFNFGSKIGGLVQLSLFSLKFVKPHNNALYPFVAIRFSFCIILNQKFIKPTFWAIFTNLALWAELV